MRKKIGGLFFGLLLMLPLLWSSQLTAEGLVYNPGPSYITTLNLGNIDWPTGCWPRGTELWEGHLDSNPSNQWGGATCSDGIHRTTPDSSRPTTFHDVYGWAESSGMIYPGWDIWRLSGGGGTVLEYQYHNSARYAPNPCELREVGFLYHTFGGQDYSFKPGKKFGQYGQVLSQFTAKETAFIGPPQCGSFATAIVTNDFLVEYRDGAGNLVRWDLLGVIVDNHNGFPVNCPTFWEDNCSGGPCRKTLYGSCIGVTQLTSAYQTITIDFKQLYNQYGYPPPPGFTRNDAIPTGLHLYTSVRGADLGFAMKGINAIGQ